MTGPEGLAAAARQSRAVGKQRVLGPLGKPSGFFFFPPPPPFPLPILCALFPPRAHRSGFSPFFSLFSALRANRESEGRGGVISRPVSPRSPHLAMLKSREAATLGLPASGGGAAFLGLCLWQRCLRLWGRIGERRSGLGAAQGRGRPPGRGDCFEGAVGKRKW